MTKKLLRSAGFPVAFAPTRSLTDACWAALLLAGSALASACAPPDVPYDANGSGGSNGSSNGSTGSTSTGSTTGTAETASGGSSSTVAGDLPCDVQDFLTTYCIDCHASWRRYPLDSHTALMAPSATAPSLTRAQESVQRLLASDGSEMPPPPIQPPTADQIQMFQDWVNAGAEAGSCGDGPVVTTPNPYDTPSVCTSDSYWTGGNRESPRMNPGQACITCHTQKREGPSLTIGGTVYATAHEPDNCNGVASSSTVASSADLYVEITDADGKVFELTTNAAGNFLLERPSSFSMPYTARVVSGDQERVMLEAQDNGDCNSCHTENGEEQAPGRIMAP